MRRILTVAALAAALGVASAVEDEDTQDVAPSALAQPALGSMPPRILDAAVAARDLPLPERMKAVSEPMLGIPYLLDPLGEGEGWDPDPFARYDALDCLTFLEEVLALSMSGDPAFAADIRNTLRYGAGPLDYAHRHHFMELQWLPRNVDAGLIRPISADFGPVVHLSRDVTAATWKSWSKRKLFHLTDAELPIGPMALDVLTITEALKIVDEIPPGTIVLTVRTDRPTIPIWISHVGFTVPAETPTVRHATRMSPGKARDHGLRWYIEHLRTYKNWPALGVSLYAPIEQGPRRARMSAIGEDVTP